MKPRSRPKPPRRPPLPRPRRRRLNPPPHPPSTTRSACPRRRAGRHLRPGEAGRHARQDRRPVQAGRRQPEQMLVALYRENEDAFINNNMNLVQHRPDTQHTGSRGSRRGRPAGREQDRQRPVPGLQRIPGEARSDRCRCRGAGAAAAAARDRACRREGRRGSGSGQAGRARRAAHLESRGREEREGRGAGARGRHRGA